MSSWSRQQLEEWIKTIKVSDNSKVLDIGGVQLPINGRLVDCGKDCDFTILDLEQPHEVKQKPDIICDLNEREVFLNDQDGNLQSPQTIDNFFIDEHPIQKFDLDSKWFGNSYKGEFDCAFCLEVSEYWWNSANALNNINWYLKKGGKLYISFHFIYPVHNPVDQDYLRYTPVGAKKILKEAGFKIVNTEPRLESSEVSAELDNEYLKSIINPSLMGWFQRQKMRPAKEYDCHNWSGCLIEATKI